MESAYSLFSGLINQYQKKLSEEPCTDPQLRIPTTKTPPKVSPPKADLHLSEDQHRPLTQHKDSVRTDSSHFTSSQLATCSNLSRHTQPVDSDTEESTLDYDSDSEFFDAEESTLDYDSDSEFFDAEESTLDYDSDSEFFDAEESTLDYDSDSEFF